MVSAESLQVLQILTSFRRLEMQTKETYIKIKIFETSVYILCFSCRRQKGTFMIRMLEKKGGRKK